MNGLQSGDITSFQNINSELTLINQDLTDLDTAIQTKHNIIDASNRLNANLIATGEVSNTKFNFLKNVSSDIQAQINSLSGGGGGSSIPSITYDAGNLTTEISDITLLTTLKFSGDNSIQETAFTDTLKTDLNNNKTKLTDITYSSNKTTIANNLECNNITGTTITNINNSIDTKQDILNSSTNKLNPTYIDGGSSLTSQKITYLSSIAEDLQTKLNELQSSIDALITSDSAQTTTNTNLTNAINTLTTDKQDLLSESNKLNCANLNAGTGTMSNLKMQYLSSIGGDITDALNSKQNTITDGSLTIARTNGLQTALDAKQNTITDGSLTIARTNGLQNALDAKQNTNTTYNGIQYKVTDKGQLLTSPVSILTTELCGYWVFRIGVIRNIVLPNPSSLPDGVWIILNGISTTSSAINFSLFHTDTNTSNKLMDSNVSANTVVYGKAFAFFVASGKWMLGS